MRGYLKSTLAIMLAVVMLAGMFPAYAAGDGAFVGNDGLVTSSGGAGDFPIVKGGQAAAIWINTAESAPVQRVAGDFKEDVARVTGVTPVISTDASRPSGPVIMIGTLDGNTAFEGLLTPAEKASIQGKWEAYLIKVVDADTLVVAGSDPRGAVFGTYEISEQMGVSPWYFFSDVAIQTKSEVYIPAGTSVTDKPDVQYRGIFLNDEEKLSRWVTEVFKDPNVMGTKAYSVIFELILRLKGNYIWPAMHVNSFNNVAANIPLAQEYGIVVGSSHCDMLLRTNTHEWNNWVNANKGDYGGSISYDYTVSKDAVLKYWRENVIRHKDTEAQWTVGMRGAHDEPFNTANINTPAFAHLGATEAERKANLMNEIIREQQKILLEVLGQEKYDNSFQAFIPYKEVLPIYNHESFDLPENVTVIWCDDNHSIMRRMPDAQERQRDGGHGLYYHVSYWAPANQSYMWLSSAPLALIGEELSKSYESGITKAWVLNVGDIKPQEVEMTFFIRSGWDIEKYKNNADKFLADWMGDQFGKENGAEIADILTKWYHQAMVYKLEHMKTEVFGQTYFGDEGAKRMEVYQDLFERTQDIYNELPSGQRLGFYELVQCKVNWGYYVNKAFYYADKSNLAFDQGRMASADAFLALSQKADQDKKAEIALYGTMNNEKWYNFIDPENYAPPVITQLPPGSPALVLGDPAMGVVVEGDKLPKDNPVLTFSPYGQNGKFADIFNKGSGSFNWTASSDEDWIELTETSGTINDEIRIWVTVKNIEAYKGEKATITITNTDDSTTKTIEVEIENPDKALSAIDGYAEADGYVSIEAEHYSKLNNKGTMTWQNIKDLGRASGGDVMRAYNPALEPVENTADAPSLEYKVYLTSSGQFPLEIYRIPTLNSKGKVRFAVSVDNGEPILVESAAADEGQGTIWVSNLFHTIEKHVVELPELSSGEHTIKLWMVDNFIMIDKMVLYTGPEGIIPTELGPEESYHSVYNNSFTPSVLMLDRVSVPAEPKDIPATWGRGLFVEEAGKLSIEAEYAMENVLVSRSEVTTDMKAYTLSNADIAHEMPEKSPPNAWRLTQSDTGMAMRLPQFYGAWTEKYQFEKYSPELGYRVDFADTGTYNVWVRWRFGSDKADSIRGGIDGVYGSNFNTGAFAKNSINEKWHWDKVGVVQINSAGEHLFSMWMREDGLALDRIYLTKGSENPPEGTAWVPSARSEISASDNIMLEVNKQRAQLAENSYPLGKGLGCYSEEAYDTLVETLDNAEELADKPEITQEEAAGILEAIAKANEALAESQNLVDENGKIYNAYRDFENDEAGKFPFGIIAEALDDGTTASIIEEDSNKFFRLTTPSVNRRANMFLPYVGEVATGANGRVEIEYKVRLNNIFQYANGAMIRHDANVSDKYSMVVAFDNVKVSAHEHRFIVQNGSTKEIVQEFEIEKWYSVKMVGDWNNKTYDVYIDGDRMAKDFKFRGVLGEKLTGQFFGVDNLANGSIDFADFKVSMVAADGIQTIGGTVTIDGEAKEGETLTANISAVTPAATSTDLKYTWKRGTTVVGTENTYTPTAADVGRTLTVTVSVPNTSTEYFGSVISAPTAPVEGPGTGTPTDLGGSISIAGSPAYGETLSADIGGVTPAEAQSSLNYEWKRGDTVVGTENTYTPAEEDIGEIITLTVTGTGSYTGTLTAATEEVEKAEQQPPTGLGSSKPTGSGSGDGKITGLHSGKDYEYSDDQSAWTKVSGETEITGLEAGVYYVRLASTSTHKASAAVPVEVLDYDSPDPAPTPASPRFNTATMMLTGIDDTMEYSTDNGKSWTAVEPGENSADLSGEKLKAGGTILVRVAEDLPNNSASLPKVIGLTQAAAPAGLAGQPPTSANGTDGRILGLSGGTDYEYQSGGWIPLTSDTGLKAGTYQVRIAAEGTAFASEPVSVLVPDYVSGTTGSDKSRDNDTGTTVADTDTPRSSAVIKDKEVPLAPAAAITGQVDKNGNLSFTVTDAKVKETIKKLQEEAKKLGKTGAAAVDIKITATGGKSITAKIEGAALTSLKNAGAALNISSPVVRFSLDADAVKEIAAKTTGALTFTAVPVTNLSGEAKALTGARPVFNLTLSWQKDGKTEYITNFGKGTASIGIPYKPAAGEKTGSLYAVHVDANGKTQLINNSSYKNGWMIWSRNSLSTYGIAYKPAAEAFTDTQTHFARDDMDFVSGRGFITGTGTTFSPDASVTRADFLMALGKISGANVSGYKTSSFTDVKDTDPAMPYIEWAAAKKIAQGTGNGKFSPNGNITREQMAVMLTAYAKAIGYTLPDSRQAIVFADDAKIGAAAKTAVKAVQQAGIMSGKNAGSFVPQASVTRAEASVILRRFVELKIDESTARGWTRNDNGKRQYINSSGKVVTGWLKAGESKYYFDSNGLMVSGKWIQIGGKWYYFYTDGRLAYNATIDGYKTGADGARITK